MPSPRPPGYGTGVRALGPRRRGCVTRRARNTIGNASQIRGLSVTVEIAASATITGMIAAASDTSGRVVWCRAAAEAPGRS